MLQIHPNARTTPVVRAEIARSTEPSGVLAKRYAVSAETVRKRRKRGISDCLDRSARPHHLPWKATDEERAVVCALRQLRPRLDRLAGDNAAAVTIVKQGAEARASGFLDVIEAHFAANGPFFLGAQISAADRYLTMLARWARPMTNQPRSRPHIARLLDAVIARPAVKRAYATEGISEQIC